MKLAIVLIVAVIAAACTKQPKTDKEPEATKKPSTVKTAIDGFTGKTAVKQGKKAMSQIEAVSEKKNSELDEVM